MNFLNAFLNVFSTVNVTPPATDATPPALTFEPMRFLDMLVYMGKGMLVIFVLIGIIVLVTMLINKVFSQHQ